MNIRQCKVLGGLLLATLITACATPPTANSIPERGVDWISALDQSCSNRPTNEVLQDSIGNQNDISFIRRVSSIETALTGRPLVAGNEVTLLIDGPATHNAQLEAIRNAQHHIHMDMYIFTDDELGNQYRQALTERAKAGVQVRIVYDSIGSLTNNPFFLRGMKSDGVQLHEYHSVNPLLEPRIWRINRRNHRKMLIIDGQTAFTGGINIMDEYQQASAAEEGQAPLLTPGWRDTHIKIEGPAVAEFQRLFLRHWEKKRGQKNFGPEYFPLPVGEGPSLVRVVTNQGADFLKLITATGEDLYRSIRGQDQQNRQAIYQTYLTAIYEARKRVWITQAYFAPNQEFLDALVAAARRGVDVRLLMPGQSDVGLLLHASRYYYQQLLDAGIGIYEYDAAMIHAKTAVIDGVWSTVGSSNLDFRSFIHNDEANAVIVGQKFGGQMEHLFENDLTNARKINREQWQKRPWSERIKQWSSVLLKYWI